MGAILAVAIASLIAVVTIAVAVRKPRRLPIHDVTRLLPMAWVVRRAK